MLTNRFNEELEKGFSIRDLENLIGLPKNSLSSVLAGKRKLSKVCTKKSERYLNDPIDFFKYLVIKEVNKKVAENNLPENKERILNERNTPHNLGKNHNNTIEIKNALNSTETKKEVKADSNFEKHKLWKKGDPSENTNAFYMRYECWNYEELETIKAHKQ